MAIWSTWKKKKKKESPDSQKQKQKNKTTTQNPRRSGKTDLSFCGTPNGRDQGKDPCPPAAMGLLFSHTHEPQGPLGPPPPEREKREGLQNKGSKQHSSCRPGASRSYLPEQVTGGPTAAFQPHCICLNEATLLKFSTNVGHHSHRIGDPRKAQRAASGVCSWTKSLCDYRK